MKILSWLKILLIVSVLLVPAISAYSQVAVERSKDKVIISGIQYYIHQVKKGETAYSISKAYGITVDDLTRENPSALQGIKEGQALRIPVASVSEIKPAEAPVKKMQHDETRFIYHNMAQGETVYSLSKLYGVSEEEIIRSNTGIDINKLSIGTEIAIPRKVFINDKQKFDDQKKPVGYHKVLKGETFSSIAEKYGITVRELKKENKEIKFPQVGGYVRIPGLKAEEPQTEVVKTDTITVPAAVDEPEVEKSLPAGFSKIKELKGKLNLAVMLPFYLAENSSRIDTDQSSSDAGDSQEGILRGEDWIYPGSFDFVEMYEGILMAADTLRSLGLDINIYPFDIKSDTIELTRLIRSGKLAKMDLVIGPVYSNNLNIMASYAKSLDIPVISPVPLINNSALKGNPTLFLSNSSLEVAQEAIARKISEDHDNNIIFIHSDSTGMDPDVKRFKKQIINELSYKIPYEKIKFRELLFYSRSMFDSDSINRLNHALSENSKNIVVIASEDAPVVSETIMEIHNLSRKFDVSVFGYPGLRDIETLEPKYLFDLNVMVYSPYWIDYSKDDVKIFNSAFRQKFLTEPSEKSYAWQGYDIAYYFISGIAMHGKEFIKHPSIHNPDLLETQFDFKRKKYDDGFENKKMFLIRYSDDYEIKLAE